MIGGVAAGIGICVFVVGYFLINLLADKFQNLTFYSPTLKNNRNQRIVFGAFAGFMAGLILTTGATYNATASMIFAGLGAAVVEITYRLTLGHKEDKRRRECFLLFTAVEMFVQSGLSIPQALTSAREFTPSLAGSINKCLAAWNRGGVKALELLQKDINLPEGEQLTSLLLQINQMGAKNLQNIIQIESKQLEEKRKALERARITQKPMFLMIYRLMPLVVLMGMMAGVLVTRVFISLESIL